MKEIKLTQKGKNKGKYVALVDDEDFEYLNQWNWYILNSRGILYAVRWIISNKKARLMHCFLMNPPKGLCCDHIDHNGLNNQKNNLRICTHAQNMSNRSAYGKSSYLGVSYSRNKYIVAALQVNKKTYYLGKCDTEEQAARRYDAAALFFKGEFANLNFK